MSDSMFDNLSWERYLNRLREKSRVIGNPLLANLELTPRCNFNCKMCYVHLTEAEAEKIGREHSAAEWIRLGRQLSAAGTLMLLLTGGEVFLRPDFREIYEAFSEMGFVLIVYSNGYLLNEETIAWLSKRPPMRFRISMYGASNETYEKVTGVKYAYDKVTGNIEMLLKAGIPLSLSATLIEENVDDFEAIKQFAIYNHLSLVYTGNIVKPVRGAHSEAEKCRLDQIAEKRKSLMGHEVQRVDSIYRSGPEAFAKCESRNCGLWVTWDGKMSICAFIEKPCSNPFETGFTTAWDQLQAQLRKVRRPEKCIGCKYDAFCASCPGTFASETGYIDQTCDRICEKARTLYELYSTSYLNDCEEKV